MKKYYTGIGSRKTPKNIQRVFTELAHYLEELGYTLRSGAANGADSAFEAGVISDDNKQIFLPWRGFNGSTSQLYQVDDIALNYAGEIHPDWMRCSDAAKKLHARNVYQVMGKDYKTFSEFVICWTPNGNPVGGTATAINLAKTYKIPVLNLGNPKYVNYYDDAIQWIKVLKSLEY